MKGRDVAPVPGGTSIRKMDKKIWEGFTYLLRHIINDEVEGWVFVFGTGNLPLMGGIDSTLVPDVELISGSALAQPRFFFFAMRVWMLL